MKLSNKRIAEIEAADEHAPGGMGLPFISELLAEREEREKVIDTLHEEIGRLEKEIGSLEEMIATRDKTVERWRNAEDECQKDLTHAIARAEKAEADNERLKDRLYVAESYLTEAGVELPDRIQDSRLQKAEKALEAVRGERDFLLQFFDIDDWGDVDHSSPGVIVHEENVFRVLVPMFNKDSWRSDTVLDLVRRAIPDGKVK